MQRIMHKSKVCARIKKYLKGGAEILQHIREFRLSSDVLLLLFDFTMVHTGTVVKWTHFDKLITDYWWV